MLISKILILSSMFFMVNMSPVIMMVSILVFSAMMMIIHWIESANPWMPLIFTLAFLGGMMIIFMYIISISSTKNKKNKNKLPIVFVFVSLSVWSLKYGSSGNLVHTILSSFFTQYMLLASLVLMILFVSTKIINSPFKALKSSL